ncbi:SO_0444 family Cu/Zn efflux transporter [Alteromonas sp. KUL49]|uniref:SO_0444 family Cu/Zn efflux transporter n=1 Tax=Alteromonas sp. KUL49 TaxID=2480798 RepID=UPI00102F130D|nr:SO_0444 family Cu/Zn efflux transporter [Alteromonas sp. KUL49]TAP37996.1 permease [Alteromonas sp. KUL49]
MTDVLLLLQNFASLFVESAPWLLLGLFVAGVMHEVVPISFLQKHMGSSSISAITKSAFIGAPLPLCSCGVIPAAIGLRRSGASKSSTVSFLVSTPETGVDSVSVSYALLGPLYAVVRPVAAIFSAIFAGLMVRWFDNESSSHTHKPVSSCCSGHGHENHEHHQHTVESSSNKSLGATLGKVWQFASGKLLEDIVKWLLVGLMLAAVIKTWVPTDFLTQWGDGFVAMLVMALIGVPMYICATASTPIAVGFLAAGLSPGAILVFLMAGPATNVSTMGMIKQEMGTRTLVLYIFSVMSTSIAAGYGLNWLISHFELSQLIYLEHGIHHHGEGGQWVYILSALLLGFLIGKLGYQSIKKRLISTQHKTSNCCH